MLAKKRSTVLTVLVAAVLVALSLTSLSALGALDRDNVSDSSGVNDGPDPTPDRKDTRLILHNDTVRDFWVTSIGGLTTDRIYSSGPLRRGETAMSWGHNNASAYDVRFDVYELTPDGKKGNFLEYVWSNNPNIGYPFTRFTSDLYRLAENESKDNLRTEIDGVHAKIWRGQDGRWSGGARSAAYVDMQVSLKGGHTPCVAHLGVNNEDYGDTTFSLVPRDDQSDRVSVVGGQRADLDLGATKTLTREFELQVARFGARPTQDGSLLKISYPSSVDAVPTLSWGDHQVSLEPGQSVRLTDGVPIVLKRGADRDAMPTYELTLERT